jgi:hypothetical protein
VNSLKRNKASKSVTFNSTTSSSLGEICRLVDDSSYTPPNHDRLRTAQLAKARRAAKSNAELEDKSRAVKIQYWANWAEMKKKILATDTAARYPKQQVTPTRKQ